MNVRGAGAFALMFAVSLLLLQGCRSPQGPEAPRTGTVSFTVERLDMPRAVMPDIDLDGFDGFTVEFSHAAFTAPAPRSGTLAYVSGSVELAAGSGWTVYVSAILGGNV